MKLNPNLTRAMVIFFLLLTGCNTQRQTNQGPAPDFERPAVDGAQVSLDDYAGKQPVLLYFHMAVG